MPRRRRYRRWSAEEKRSICRETRAPGVSVAQVARRHALNANLIFKWLKDLRFAPAGAVEAAPGVFPVEIHGDDVPTARMPSPGHGTHGRIEIILATEHRLIAEGPFDAGALAKLLSVLARPLSRCPRARASGWPRVSPTCARASTAWRRWPRRCWSRSPIR